MPDPTTQYSPSMQPCGWYGSINEFFSFQKEEWLASLEGYHQKHLLEPASASQIRAWESSYQVLQVELKKTQSNNSVGPHVDDYL